MKTFQHYILWGFYIIYISWSYVPPVPSSSTLICLFSNFMSLKNKIIKFNFYCPHIPGCRAVYWSIIGLPGAPPLKKKVTRSWVMDALRNSIPLWAGMLTNLMWCRQSQHLWVHEVGGPVTLDDTDSFLFSPVTDSYKFSAISSPCSLGLGEVGRRQTSCLWLSVHWHSFSPLWSAVCVYFNHLPLLKATLMSSERCTDLWVEHYEFRVIKMIF